MSNSLFARMPDHARAYVFAASRPLTEVEALELLSQIDPFLADWRAHGEPLAADREWRDGRFLIIGVDESRTRLSGCSIDDLSRTLKTVEARTGVRLTDNDAVFFREGSEIRRVTRREFSDLVRTGSVTAATKVFDNTVSKLGELRNGRWELPFGESWHFRAYGRLMPAGADVGRANDGGAIVAGPDASGPKVAGAEEATRADASSGAMS